MLPSGSVALAERFIVPNKGHFHCYSHDTIGELFVPEVASVGGVFTRLNSPPYGYRVLCSLI